MDATAGTPVVDATTSALSSIIESIMAQTAARKAAPVKAYKVKNQAPFPHGYLKLDTNGFGSMYMGRDESLNIGEGYPVYSFRVLIRLQDSDEFESDEEGEEIGHIVGYIVKTSDGDFQTACDVVSEELHQMAVLLFDKHGMMTNGEDDSMWEIMGDVMYIEQMYIKPKYRGYGVGLLAMHHLIDIMPSHGQLIVALAPCPINSHYYDRSKDKKDDPFNHGEKQSKEDHTAGVEKLGEYYSLMGFEKWTTDEQDKKHSLGLGIWGLWTGYVQPDIRKVLPHLFEYPRARLNRF